eukprot:1035904_1
MTDQSQDPVQDRYSGLCNANQLFMGFIATEVGECKTSTINDIDGKITAAATTISDTTATKVDEKLAIKLEPLYTEAVNAINSAITNEATGITALSTAVTDIN